MPRASRWSFWGCGWPSDAHKKAPTGLIGMPARKPPGWNLARRFWTMRTCSSRFHPFGEGRIGRWATSTGAPFARRQLQGYRPMRRRTAYRQRIYGRHSDARRTGGLAHAPVHSCPQYARWFWIGPGATRDCAALSPGSYGVGRVVSGAAARRFSSCCTKVRTSSWRRSRLTVIVSWRAVALRSSTTAA